MRSAQTVFVRSCLLLLLLFETGGRAIAQLQMGPEFRVNNGTAGHQMDPRVAVDAAGNVDPSPATTRFKVLAG